MDLKFNNTAHQFVLEKRIEGERIIAITRIILCIFLFILVIIIFFNGMNTMGNTLIQALIKPAFIMEIIGISVSVLLSIWILGKVKQRKYYNWMPYVFPIIDITFLNIIIYFNAIPANSLIITGAPTFIYFIFLVLAGFRNSPASVIVTGIYISVSYMLISIFHVQVPLHILKPQGTTFVNIYGSLVDTALDDEYIKPIIFLAVTTLIAFNARRSNKIIIEQTSLRAKREETRISFTNKLKKITENILSSSSSITETVKLFAQNIDKMVSSLRKIGEQTNSAFGVMDNTVATISGIIHSIESVAGNIARQASLVQEGGASIEEMASSISQTTSTSKKADAVADNLLIAAKEGEKTVQEVADAIKQTEGAGKEIEEIVEFISQIADTTNMLAMNAAIEAAHAGEAGRGFAVVADEIRMLAEKTGANVNRIKEILQDILIRIANISALSEEAENRLKSILKDASNTADINSEVLSAMESESKAASEILDSFQKLMTITENVRTASAEQAEGGKDILSQVNQLKSQADSVSNLTKNQLEQCRHIDDNTVELEQVIKRNNDIMNALEGLVSEI